MFVGRRLDGTIYGMWTCRQPNDADHQGMEELPDDHIDVTTFLSRPSSVAGKSLDERVAALEMAVNSSAVEIVKEG